MQLTQSKLMPAGHDRPVHIAACKTSLRTLGRHRSQSRHARTCITKAADPDQDRPVVPPLAANVPLQEPQQQQSQQLVPASAVGPASLEQQQQATSPKTQQSSIGQQLQQQKSPEQQQPQLQRQAQQVQPQQRTVQAPRPPAAPAQQQQQQQQQQRAASTAPPRLQQPSWLQLLLSGLQHTPPTVLAFLLGGFAACWLLFGWARGSPMRRRQPYSFTLNFREASKLDVGTPVRMKGVQIGAVTRVATSPSHVTAFAEIQDCGNIIPRSSRVDINLLGLAADPWIDITPPVGCLVRKEHGPHHPECSRDGLIVCDGGHMQGSQGGSTDFMTKFFLSQHDRTRVKVGDAWYTSRASSSSSS